MEPVQRIFSAVVGGEVDLVEAQNPQALAGTAVPLRPGRPERGHGEPIRDRRWRVGNGMQVIGRDGAVVDIVGAALVAAAADEEEPASVVDPNPGSP